MIRVDLHLHTLPSKYSDADFEFSLDFLVEYVNKLSLDVIAITNHNLFDQVQFDDIVDCFNEKQINCKVLPGVEIDYESGHMLVIASPEDSTRLFEQCIELEKIIFDKNSTLKHEEFINIFRNYDDYLLIPHYEKRPKVPKQFFSKFDGEIFLGEVSNAKKFEVIKKEESNISPVLFSDYRISKKNYEFIFEKNNPLTIRTTYLDFTYSTFKNFKLNLKSKDKIFSNKERDVDLIEIDSNGTLASNGINLILGNRSTGKTFLLDTINNSMNVIEGNQVKYIKQFEITKNSEEEVFKNSLAEETQEYADDYLMPLKSIINKVASVDIDDDIKSLDTYIQSLKDFAETTSLDNIFSKATLYTEDEFYIVESNKLKNIIENLILLYNDENYFSIVEKHLNAENFSDLINDLIEQHRKEKMEIELKNQSNLIIENIKFELSKKSSKKSIKKINFSEIGGNIYRINKFNKNIELFSTKKELENYDVLNFRKIISREQINTGNHLKNKILKTQIGVTNNLNKYLETKDAYNFLRNLLKSRIDISDLYKVFVEISTDIYDNSGKKISGGQRAEYNLLKNIKDAQNYDYLLLDEPEGAFDNPFLKASVIELIREIGATTTVFVSTHNSTLGSLLDPNYILNTEFDKESFDNGEKLSNCFAVYGNYFSQTRLYSHDKKEVSNYNVLIENMEAGEDAYESKAELYESLKD